MPTLHNRQLTAVGGPFALKINVAKMSEKLALPAIWALLLKGWSVARGPSSQFKEIVKTFWVLFGLLESLCGRAGLASVGLRFDISVKY